MNQYFEQRFNRVCYEWGCKTYFITFNVILWSKQPWAYSRTFQPESLSDLYCSWQTTKEHLVSGRLSHSGQLITHSNLCLNPKNLTAPSIYLVTQSPRLTVILILTSSTIWSVLISVVSRDICLQPVRRLLNVSEAELACNKAGGMLASIINDEEMNEIQPSQ